MNKKLWLIPAAFIVTPLGAAKGLVIEMHHIDRDGTGAARLSRSNRVRSSLPR